jgi:TP901 family phage tail tape measure protein
MAQARSSLASLQSSLNDINPGGLASIKAPDIAATQIEIPAPEIAQPVIPSPELPQIDIAAPDIGQPVIPTPDAPILDGIPAPDVSQPEIPIPETPILGDIPAPGVGTPEIPAPDTSAFSQGLAEIESGLNRIQENTAFNTLATQLSTMSLAMGPITQSLDRMMSRPSALAAAFDSSMKNIQAITGNTNQEMAALNQQLLAIGANAVAGPQGVVDAMYDIAGGIGNVEAHLGILQGAVTLAEAGQADLGVAANGLVSIMNAYSLASGDAASSLENANNVSDVLTQTVGQGVGSMEQFIAAFSQVSGVSAAVGVGFDELGAALAFITTQGPGASEAATQLKAAETALLNPNETLLKALQSVGIESGSAMLSQYGLVASLNIVKQAVGGSQDAMAKALGSTMALQGATALLGDGYTEFANKFSGALQNSITAEAAAVQGESYESKLARMNAATQALQLQIGDNINNIKGFFLDLGSGFLSNVVNPILNSPVGGVFQQMAAVIGVAGQNLLSFGSNALSTAATISTLAANIKNAGGYTEILHGAMTLLKAPFSAVGGMVKGFITNLFGMGAAGAAGAGGVGAFGTASGVSAAPIGAATAATTGFSIALNAALWPILAVIAAVAAVAAGVYLLIKNWDAVSEFFVNLWNNIVSAFQAAWDWIVNIFNVAGTWISAFFSSLWARITETFAPVGAWFGEVWNGITAAFATAWNAVAAFFTDIWNGIVNTVANVANWFTSAWNNVVTGFTNLWNGVTLFFTNLWNGITNIVASVANWFAGIWGTVTAPFASAFQWIGNLFTNIWNNIKGVIQGFVEWLSPVVDAILAPFRAIGNVIGGIINTVGGWFGGAAKDANEAVASMEAAPVTTTTTSVAATSIPAASVVEPPSTAVSVATPSLSTGTATVTPLGSTATVGAVDLGTGTVAAPELTAAGSVAVPEFTSGASAASPSFAATGTTSTSSSGNALALQHMEAASYKGVSASDMTYTASSAFDSAGAAQVQAASTAALLDSLNQTVAASLNAADLEEEARVSFADAMPQREAAVTTQAAQAPARNEQPRQNIFHIANMNFNADEMRTIFDFVRQLELMTAEPEALAV